MGVEARLRENSCHDEPGYLNESKEDSLLEPLEFIERISHCIPYPHRHRRHYHDVFSSNSPMRNQVVANAKKRPKLSVAPIVKEVAERVVRPLFRVEN